MKTKLRDITMVLLKDRLKTTTLSQIARESKVPLGWLKYFANGETADPSVNRIETLYEWLSGKSLF